MQQQKLNVVNTISLKGVSSRYMTSRIYHPEKRKCYIFVGTSQMIYFLSIKKDGGEQYKEQEQQVYKLQELKKLDQIETVFTCLSTMIYKDEVVVLAGFVNKQTFQSQVCAYSLNSNLIYHNGNLFNESKINLVNLRQVTYSKIQFLFTSSSDNAIRIFRFVEPKQKKYQFELQFLHSYKFDEFIIDFDMKCILSTEQCVFSHQLGNNKVSVDNYDGDKYQHEYMLTSTHISQKDAEQVDGNKPISKTMQEFKLTHQSSQEFIQKQGKTSGEIQSQQGLDNQKVGSSNNLKFPSIGDYNSSHTLELSHSVVDDNLPNLDKLKKTSTNDGRESISDQLLKQQSFKNKQKSLTVKVNPFEQIKNFQQNEEDIIEEASAENSTLATKKHSQDYTEREFTRKDSGQRAQTIVMKEINKNKNANEIASCSTYNKSPVKQLQQEIRQNNISQSMQNSLNQAFTKLYQQQSMPKNDGSQPFVKFDEMYISFTDIDGLVIVKKLLINPLGTDLTQSFQKSVTQYQVDLGIAGSYCRFIKCMDNQLENFPESSTSAQLLSKKQQKRQVYQQKKQMQLNLQPAHSMQHSYDDEDEKSLKDAQQLSSLQNLQQNDESATERQEKNAPMREVNLNLIVTNLMGDIIEFKNVPLQGLDNPVSFPSIDNFNSGVTGLCIKSQDTLEMLVSYFDGSVIFFDLNNEDQWNLKLSQPLNSNHFGVYYENTQESDIVFLVSDDTIQIYELNSYHIN